MTTSKPADERDDAPRLRLDIHLNLEEHSDPDGPLAWLAQFAKAEPAVPSTETLADFACKLYQSRRLRTRYINASLLGEPVWDMLLALYCFSARGEALSVSGLCHAAEVPQTTALRWVQVLEQRKLISRSRDSRDGRRTFVSLTGESRKMMDDYLAVIRGAKPLPNP